MKKEIEDIHIRHIEGLKCGRQADFNKLYSIYADLLYGFVLNLTKSPSIAEDVLQETFLRIWQRRESVSIELSFKSYLYTIAKNLVMDSFRKQVQNINFDTYIQSEYQHPVEDYMGQKINFDDFTAKLESAKEKLPPRQKEVFELSKEKGLTITQISEQLDISQKTVKNQLSLALKTIKQELTPLLHVILLMMLKQ
ncbi:RNA polymerase sigma-70 factor (ECF subfamily) [Mucilaginibacter gracilis]|uniref:RNA polymerase sigma factor n=1 Tax=Mucilaginibacter gracilis TaxID=423350 RepID=A0A495J4W5_9SPHI|nr:RNA polymerase sigma-70 factor [Mucilaginibacter gracilis]RKR84020.1 RNA polymerase sigma-70 factor (ECF subfamily) [Mucilaginibacter gracilis]